MDDSFSLTNAGLSRCEAVGFVLLVLPERSDGMGHRLSPAFSVSEANRVDLLVSNQPNDSQCNAETETTGARVY